MNNNGKNNFDKEFIRRDLKRKTVQSIFSRVIFNGISAFMTIASTVILARLLTPEEFGLFAMVVAVMDFARTIREMGLGSATVQREKIVHDEVSNLFWINIGVGLLMMVLMVCLAPLVVWIYGDERLFNICIFSSIVFLFGGMTVQHRALLERQMRFVDLGIIYIASTFLSIVMAVSFALYGFSFWALVLRDVTFAGFYAFGTWIFLRWLPGLPKKDVNIRSYLKFGAEVTGFDLLQYLNLSIDRILIGRYSGAGQLGLYTKAMQLVMMPVEHIRMTVLGLGLSALSALESDADRYQRYFSKILLGLTAIYMPLVIFIGIQAGPLIRLVLGEEWMKAVPLLQVFCLAGYVRPISAACYIVMVSCAMTKRYLKVGAIKSACMIIAIVLGIRWGAEGVAWAYSLASLGLLTWELWYCLRGTPIKASLVIKTISFPVLSSCGTGILLICIMSNINSISSPLNVLASLVVSVLVYLCFWMAFPNARRKFFEFLSYRTELFSKKNI